MCQLQLRSSETGPRPEKIEFGSSGRTKELAACSAVVLSWCTWFVSTVRGGGGPPSTHTAWASILKTIAQHVHFL